MSDSRVFTQLYIYLILQNYYEIVTFLEYDILNCYFSLLTGIHIKESSFKYSNKTAAFMKSKLNITKNYTIDNDVLAVISFNGENLY